MSMNPGSLPSELINRTILGLHGEDGALIDLIGTRQPVSQPSGTVPTLPSSSMLANISEGGIAEGAESKVHDMAMGSASYNVSRYVGITSIPDGVASAIDDLGIDALETCLMTARQISAAKLNNDLSTLLASTSANKSQAATAAWNGGSPSIIKDLQAAMRLIGYAGDVCVIGQNVMEEMQRDGAFLAANKNFNAGAVTDAVVVEILRGLFPMLKDVVVGHNLYNTANEGQTAVLGHQFDDLVWLGARRGLVYAEQETEHPTEQGRSITKESTDVRFTRRIHQIRAEQDLGVVVTGVIT